MYTKVNLNMPHISGAWEIVNNAYMCVMNEIAIA